MCACECVCLYVFFPVLAAVYKQYDSKAMNSVNSSPPPSTIRRPSVPCTENSKDSKEVYEPDMFVHNDAVPCVLPVCEMNTREHKWYYQSLLEYLYLTYESTCTTCRFHVCVTAMTPHLTPPLK